jgi:ParB family chromosome partitioning protein
MSSIRDKLADKKTKLARPRERLKDHPAHSEYQEGSFYNIPIREIRSNPDQPRKYFNEESLGELSQSIRARGILQPVIIRREEDGTIFLVAGERRLRAARQAGLEQLPAILTKGHPAEIALIENLQREDLKPIEEAEALARMVEEYQYTQEQLAGVIGKAQSTISETLSLNKLPDELKDEYRRADIPRRLLVEIAKQKSPEVMAALFKKVEEANLTSDQVREISRSKSSRKKRAPVVAVINKVVYLKRSLEKLNLDTVEDREKIQLLAELKNLQGLIDQIIR